MQNRDGGHSIASVLKRNRVTHLFTLCGGHISPILVGARAHGLTVVDVRDEASSVFAADAYARLTGRVGVAAVTAGPGVTNTVTAVKNAQMAQSPIVLLGGSAATILRGRGSLQDIDQISLMKPVTKAAFTVRTVKSLSATIEHAFETARSGVPGPVFVEVPIDLLYDEATVLDIFLKEAGVHNAKGVGGKALELAVRAYLYRQFHQPHVSFDVPSVSFGDAVERLRGGYIDDQVRQVAGWLRHAERPVLIVGSQALVNCSDPAPLARAIESLGIPTWLGGAARGLLGTSSSVQFLHHRTSGLREADVVVVAGFPFDFRLGYGRKISSRARIASINLSSEDLRKNRRPTVAVHDHPADFLARLARQSSADPSSWAKWFEKLREREATRDSEIQTMVQNETSAPGTVHPIALLSRLDAVMADDAIMVVDGGDFVATASYVVRPRRPLSWLDPGVFGTLGVGGGFAIGALAAAPGRELWIVYGDGSSAYSLAEFDTCVRHGFAPIALIGNDGAWAQIAREQVPLLGDAVATQLRRSDYDKVAEGYGGVGLRITDPSHIDSVLLEAKRIAASGRPVLINAMIGGSDFRQGSISM